MDNLIDINIIDRTEEEKKKAYDIACAEGLEITVEELKSGVREIIENEKREKEYKDSGMFVSISHTALAGRIMLFCDVERLIGIWSLKEAIIDKEQISADKTKRELFCDRQSKKTPYEVRYDLSDIIILNESVKDYLDFTYEENSCKGAYAEGNYCGAFDLIVKLDENGNVIHLNEHPFFGRVQKSIDRSRGGDKHTSLSYRPTKEKFDNRLEYLEYMVDATQGDLKEECKKMLKKVKEMKNAYFGF
jgi:hypothetical protein